VAGKSRGSDFAGRLRIKLSAVLVFDGAKMVFSDCSKVTGPT